MEVIKDIDYPTNFRAGGEYKPIKKLSLPTLRTCNLPPSAVLLFRFYSNVMLGNKSKKQPATEVKTKNNACNWDPGLQKVRNYLNFVVTLER